MRKLQGITPIVALTMLIGFVLDQPAMGRDGRTLDACKTLAEQLRASSDPDEVLKSNRDVLTAIKLKEDKGFLVKLQSSDDWVKMESKKGFNPEWIDNANLPAELKSKGFIILHRSSNGGNIMKHEPNCGLLQESKPLKIDSIVFKQSDKFRIIEASNLKNRELLQKDIIKRLAKESSPRYIKFFNSINKQVQFMLVTITLKEFFVSLFNSDYEDSRPSELFDTSEENQSGRFHDESRYPSIKRDVDQ